MDTFTPDGSTGFKSPRLLRRWATTAGTGSLIVMAAAYVALRPATLAQAAESNAGPIAAAIAPVVHTAAASDPMMANLMDDTVSVLGKTFVPTTQPGATADAWLRLFPTAETSKKPQDAVAATAAATPLAVNTTDAATSGLTINTVAPTGEAAASESSTPAFTAPAPTATDTTAANTNNSDTTNVNSDTTTAAATPFITTTPPTNVPAAVDVAARTAADVVWVPAAAPAAAVPAAAAATGPTPIITSGLDQQGTVRLSVNRTAEIKTSVPVKRVSIGQPEIADVSPFSPNLILVTAKKPGMTQVIVWDDQDRSQSIDVNVEIPLEQLRNLVGKIAPGTNIDVSVAADTIVLRGHAPNLTIAKQIGDVAGAFGKVQNFIEVAGAQTVAVQVQFAEVSRDVTTNLGVSWAYQNGTSVFGSDTSASGIIGLHANDAGLIDSFSASTNPTPFNLFGLGTISGNPFSYFIRALRDSNLLRVLQEPTLTTTSGEPASFLAGGQVAVPVPSDNGTIGIEYKEFGVRLKLTPIVLGNGKIRLICEAESSDLDYANGTKIKDASVPGLRTRRVTNTVELGEGQTLSIAGLLDDSVTATKQSVPGLGDIPVLGQLFRSTRYQRKETELVVLITPRLAGAMNPDQVSPLPGANWRHPNDLEQFAFGDMGGNPEADPVKDWDKPNDKRGLKPGMTQQNNPSYEPAAQTARGDKTPPLFLGEHGFEPAATSDVTSARD